jgi:hypothetical protein
VKLEPLKVNFLKASFLFDLQQVGRRYLIHH